MQSVLFQTVQDGDLPLNLSLDFYYAVMSDVVPVGTFADAAYFSIYQSTNAATLRPDLGQFDSVSSIFDATFSGFTNLAPGVSIQPSSRGPDWWTVVMTNYSPTHNFIAPTLEVYNFNGIANDSTAPMTDVVVSVVPEPGIAALLCLAFVFALIVRARRVRHLPVVFLALLCTAGPLHAQNVTALGSRVRVATANETSNFDRATRVITQTAEVTLTNAGDRPIKAPLRVRIALAGEGDLARVTLGDVVAGGGDDTRPFRDLSALLPAGGLAPGGSIQFTLRIVRPFDVPVSYQLEAQGVFNRDPVPAFDAPLAAVAGEEVAFDAGASEDGDGGKQISYAWDFGDGGASDGAAPKRAFAKPGRYDVVLTVTDGENAKAVLRKTITVLPSANFAVARTRTLDASGQPLGGVSVRQRAGTDVTESSSDAATGFAALGGEPGEYVWRFSRDGYLPAWRKATLAARQILFVPSPWMVRENAKDKPVSPLRELVLGGSNEPATITFAAGAFAAEGSAGFTPIGPQALPLPLPAGWSPLGAFYLSLPSAPSQPGNVTWAPSDRPASDDALAVLKYDTDLLQWTVLSLPAPGSSPSSQADASGTYALVVADKGARAPPSAQVGAALPAATDVAVDSSAITATGSIDPSKITASREAAAMTTGGRVVFTGASDLPSGTYFRTEIEETYNLANGRTQRTPVYDTSFFAYQRPGDTDAKTLHAAFPLRPTRILSPEQIDTAKVEADILTGDSYAASLFDPTGGRIAAENLAVSAEDGDLSGRSLAELRLLELKSFEIALAGSTGVAAFQLAVGNLADGRGLDVELSGLAPNKDFVVARHVAKDDEEGLEPVERLRSDAEGLARSVEPAEGVRLPGVTGPGQYVVVVVDGPQAVVSGVARNLAGEAVAGLAVRITGLPWLTFSAAGGAYKLVAPQGETSTVAVTDLLDGNSGSEEVVIGMGTTSATANVRAAVTAPRVASVSPADGAQKVRAATPVQIRFSEPIDPATFGPDAVRLTRDGGALIQGSLSLNPAGNEATFLPTNPLEHAATYTIELSAEVKDRQGLALTGARRFSFSVIPFFERAQGAQLVIYEPGAQNIPQSVRSMLVGYNSSEGSSHVVAHGSAGTADPEVPVILVNQNTGETATVLSKPDGSFANFVNAAEEDFIEAVFVNANGTRVTVPATKQLYDDGRIGLYRYGGILEAESDGGPVQIQIEPKAIKERTVFKLDVFSVFQLAEMLDGLSPAGGEKILGGLKLQASGDDLSERPKVTFPADNADLNLPEGADPADAAFVLASVSEVDGTKLFVVEDNLNYDGSALVSDNTHAFPGLAENETGVVISLASQQPQPQARKTIAGAAKAPKFIPPVTRRPVSKAIVNGNVKTKEGERPVVGAVVMAIYDDPNVALPIDYPEGSVVTKTGANGYFITVANGFFRASGVDAVNVSAFSNRFPNQTARARATTSFAADASAPYTAYPRFDAAKVPQGVFAGAEKVGPRINASLPRQSPPPGTDFDVDVLATSGFFAVNSIKVRVVKTTPSLPSGQSVSCSEESSDAIGELSRSAVWKLKSPIAARIDLEITSTDALGNLSSMPVTVAVGEDSAPSTSGDVRGPVLVRSFPANDDTDHPVGDPIRLVFDEPLDPSVLTSSPVSVVPDPGFQRAELRNSNRELWLSYPQLLPGTVYQVNLSSNIKDAQGNPHDQNPGTKPLDVGVVRFQTKLEQVYRPSGLGSVGGVAGCGEFIAVIDRSPGTGWGGALLVYSKSGELLSTTPLPSFPRDIVVIPDYDYLRRAGDVRNDRNLIAVVGGTGGADEIKGSGEGDRQIGQWIRVFDATDPGKPETIASRNLNFSPTSAATRLVWSAPHLGVLDFEFEPEETAVKLLNLQWLVLASGTKPPTGSGGPFFGRDVNGDGDFVDADIGEQLPYSRASRPLVGVDNAGLVTTYLTNLEETTGGEVVPFGQIYDFSMVDRGGLVGAVGRVEDEAYIGSGRGFYTTLAQAGQSVDEEATRVFFPEVPYRVTLLLGAKVQLNGRAVLRNLAVVSAGKPNTVSFVDITDPFNPAVVKELVFPASAGAPRAVSLVADGLIAVACINDMYFFNLEDLSISTSGPVARSASPSGGSGALSADHDCVRRIPGGGTSLRSFHFYTPSRTAPARKTTRSVGRGSEAVIVAQDRNYNVRLSRPGTVFDPGPQVPLDRDQDPKSCLLPVNLDFDHVEPNTPTAKQLPDQWIQSPSPSSSPSPSPTRDDNDNDLLAVTLPAIDRFPTAESIKISIDVAPVENQPIPEVKNPLGANPEYLARRLCLLQENEIEGLGAVEVDEVALPADSYSQRSQFVHETFDPGNPKASESNTKLFKALLQGDTKMFIDSTIPSPRVEVKVEVLDSRGNVLAQDMVAFAAVEARITRIWSEQFPDGKWSNTLPGNSSTQRDKPSYKYILMANRTDDITYAGGEFTLIPDSKELKELYGFRLATAPLTDYVQRGEEVYTVSVPSRIYGTSTINATEGEFSIAADEREVPLSSEERLVIDQHTTFYVAGIDFNSTPPFLERFVVGGIDQNEDGYLDPNEAHLGLYLDEDKDVDDGSGFRRGQLITGPAKSDYSKFNKGHLKVVTRALYDVNRAFFLGAGTLTDIVGSIFSVFALQDFAAGKHAEAFLTGTFRLAAEPNRIGKRKFGDRKRAPSVYYSPEDVADIHPDLAKKWMTSDGKTTEQRIVSGPIWDHHSVAFDQNGYREVNVYEYSPVSGITYAVMRSEEFRYAFLTTLASDPEFCRAMRLAAERADLNEEVYFEVPFKRRAEEHIGVGSYSGSMLTNPDLFAAIGGFVVGDVDCIVRFKMVGATASFTGVIGALHTSGKLYATSPGLLGNDIVLEFDGVRSIRDAMTSWNSRNSLNQVAYSYEGDRPQDAGSFLDSVPPSGVIVRLGGGAEYFPYKPKETQCRVEYAHGTITLLDLYDWDLEVNPGMALIQAGHSVYGDGGKPFAVQVRHNGFMPFADETKANVFKFDPIIYDIK